jgi:hypothetical protein
MDRVDELVELVPLTVGEQARLLVAARVVDVHVCHCGGCLCCVVGESVAGPRAMGRRLLRARWQRLFIVWPVRVRGERCCRSGAVRLRLMVQICRGA